jgi:hypothetical protein
MATTATTATTTTTTTTTTSPPYPSPPAPPHLPTQIPIKDKKDLVLILVSKGISSGVAMWMTTNLRRLPSGGFDFTFDIPTATSLFESFGATDFFPFLSRLDGRGPRVHLVKAGLNKGWDDPSVTSGMEGLGDGVTTTTLEDAGHWVHVDDLEGVVRTVVDAVMEGREGEGGGTGGGGL